jgi:hypothetical protein
MFRTYLNASLVFFAFLFSGIAKGQDVRIELGPDEIGLNETFTIKVTIANEKIKSYDQFPEIPGFQKQGLSQASSMNLINGQMSSSNSIIQYYKPSKKGQFTIAPFELTINGAAFSSKGKRVTVGDAKTSTGLGSGGDPFAEFFGRAAEEPEFVELEDDAFFALTVDKEEIFAGEGFTMSLAFLMSESNRAEFQFYEPAKQLDAILKKIKPNNAWEENYNISNIDPEQVTINGKRWVRYKVYEASFFPFSEGEIEIPRIGWQMIKYKVAKNPTFFGANRQEDYKTFYSTPKKIRIKPLPPHPLKNEVSVGIFQLRENIDEIEVQTGQGFEYNFGISGIGNINAITPPRRLSGANLNTFDPNVRQQINRGYGRVSGIKDYTYYITLNEAGEVALDQHFEWIYFDPQRAVYDTLKPKARIKAMGESKLNQAISSQRLGGLYDRIQTEENRFINEEHKKYFTIAINVLLLAAVALLAMLILRKK